MKYVWTLLLMVAIFFGTLEFMHWVFINPLPFFHFWRQACLLTGFFGLIHLAVQFFLFKDNQNANA